MKRVDDFKAANMQISTKDVTIKGKTFKLPISTRPIKQGEELMIYKYPAHLQRQIKGSRGKVQGAGAGRGKGR